MKQSDAKKLARTMREEADRAVQSIGSPGHPRPFYLSFRVGDEETWEVKASYGSLSADEHRRARHGYCDVRVGSYRHDQVQDGGLHDNSDEEDSYPFTDLPFGGGQDGVRHGLWRQAEVRYREAVEALATKKSYALTYLDRNRRLPSFERREAICGVRWQNVATPEVDYWRDVVRRASATVRRWPEIVDSHVRWKATHRVDVFVSSEGSVVVQNRPYYLLECPMRMRTRKGDMIASKVHYFVTDARELPNLAQLRREIRQSVARLERLAVAPKLASYAGPVLLDPVPAGLLMHEALGHRLEGNRMLSEGEGQTFRDSLNAPILPPFLSVRDDPRMDRFEGRSLVGHYSWDDEGVESQNVELVSRGVLKNFLTSRAGISPRHRSNGHGRNCRHERPISRMANTWIESHSEPGCLPDQATSNSEPGCLPGETTAGGGATDSELKRRLIDEVRRQGLPYGIRILGATGGETATEAYNFQAFLGEIDLASRVFPDGREEWIRGVDFVGTPLNAVRNILAAGNRYEVDNAFCGAESGWVPVSTISPALLVAHLELQSKADAPTSRPCYPIPWAPD